MNQPRTSNSQGSIRTLIVDDNVGSAKILAVLFSQLGQPNVELAHSGRDAIATAQVFLPEILILDLVLGDLSGVEVAKTLRQMPDFNNTLFVALSGNDSPEDRQATREAGFHLHLGKPVGVAEIQEVIARRQEMQGESF